MAETNPSKRRPRVRKSVPTVRQRAELASVEAAKPVKRGPIRKFFSALAWPFKKLFSKVHLPNNGFGRVLRKIGRGIKRVLRWLVPSYFINSWREVRLVTWPSRKESIRLTIAVFVFATVFGLMVAGVDKVLDELFRKLVLK